MSKSEDFENDDRCGLKAWRTARWDPYRRRACTKHDRVFTERKEGKPTPGLATVSARWALDSVITALIGAYAVGTFPAYLAGGLIGGAVRWLQIGRD